MEKSVIICYTVLIVLPYSIQHVIYIYDKKQHE